MLGHHIFKKFLSRVVDFFEYMSTGIKQKISGGFNAQGTLVHSFEPQRHTEAQKMILYKDLYFLQDSLYRPIFLAGFKIGKMVETENGKEVEMDKQKSF